MTAKENSSCLGTSLDELNARNYHLFKLDSRGMKTRVLAGAVNSIDKNRPFLYFENNNWLSSPVTIKQIYLWPISPIGLLFCITGQIIIECFRKIFFQHRCSLICFVFLSC